ncbi:hypothetical protein RB195_004985 [Necator americanus]|uniref:Uncharacterized protein n=1 Tax=Necator americanus TaxID=51031 RepID=A0ABR1BKN5_NECAM
MHEVLKLRHIRILKTYYGYTNGVPRRKRDEYYCARFEHIGNDDNIVNIINHHPYTHISVKKVRAALDKNKAGEAAPRKAPKGGNNISASVSAERRDAGDHEYRSELDMGYCSSANSYCEFSIPFPLFFALLTSFRCTTPHASGET